MRLKRRTDPPPAPVAPRRWYCNYCQLKSDLLPATQRVDINGQRLDGRITEAILPRWHHAILWRTDLGDNIVHLSTIEPDRIRQIRTAEFQNALGIFAMAG